MTALRSGALALLIVAAGCRTFRAAPPAGFVELEDQEHHGYDFRATSADGLVLAVRAIPNDARGDAGFWTKALSNRLRDMGGYALLGTREVKARTGHAGTQLRFGHDEGRAPHLYAVTLFVTPDRLYLIEAGGEKKLFEANAAKVDAFVADFAVK